MVILTPSLKEWLWRYHREELPLILLGHTELLTPEKKRDYVDWCRSEEGRKYLKSGSQYKEEETE